MGEDCVDTLHWNDASFVAVCSVIAIDVSHFVGSVDYCWSDRD